MEYLFYKIDTVEPVKMSGQNKAEETQGSLDYITGSSVRGAMIGQYERIFKISLSENADVKRKLLKDVFFLNAYPMSADPLTGKAIRTLPAPFCFYTDKKIWMHMRGRRFRYDVDLTKLLLLSRRTRESAVQNHLCIWAATQCTESKLKKNLSCM